jgi:hypothetical protein
MSETFDYIKKYVETHNESLDAEIELIKCYKDIIKNLEEQIELRDKYIEKLEIRINEYTDLLKKSIENTDKVIEIANVSLDNQKDTAIRNLLK